MPKQAIANLCCECHGQQNLRSFCLLSRGAFFLVLQSFIKKASQKVRRNHSDCRVEIVKQHTHCTFLYAEHCFISDSFSFATKSDLQTVREKTRDQLAAGTTLQESFHNIPSLSLAKNVETKTKCFNFHVSLHSVVPN